MNRLRGLSGVAVIAAGALLGARGAVAADPWLVVVPDRPGPQFPAAGVSLFDELFSTPDGHDLPFPFERLIEALNERIAPARVRTALIPLGRSLQRYAADPDYFGSPRLVVAVDADPGDLAADAPRLRDRLFLGYQPAAEAIEVISYNDVAGRFEFQEVSDYGPGQTPRVEHAARDICVRCHQGHGPIFSRPLWSESNADLAIAERLTGLGGMFHGAPVRQGIDALDDFDQSTDRANRIAAIDLLWSEGCGEDAAGIDCRAALLSAALLFRLSGQMPERAPWADDAARLQGRLAELWPAGIAVPNPDLPNREPLVALASVQRPSEILDTVGPLDPETRRPPLVLWKPASDSAMTFAELARLVAELFATSDAAWLDRQLSAKGGAVQVRSARCRVQPADRDGARTELRMSCGGRTEPVSLGGFVSVGAGAPVGGRIDTLSIDGGATLHRLRVTGGHVERDGPSWSIILTVGEGAGILSARLPTGERIAELHLAGTGDGAARLDVMIADETPSFDSVLAAVADDAGGGLGPGPFNRRSLLAALGRALAAQ